MSAVIVRRALALALVALVPSAALAQRGGRGGGSAPAPRAAPQPVSRPAPAPQPRPAAPSAGGFNFSHDINARPAPQIAPRPPIQVQRPQPQPQPRQPQRVPQPVTRQAQPAQHYAPLTTAGAGPYARRFHGPVVRYPHYNPQPWTWNHGVAWAPAPIYWGGGFWGPWAIADLSVGALFGSITYDQIYYPSYQVEPNSPGAQLLSAYGLQQTPCGPPGLVVIWGPDNSLICAYPNTVVAPGNYEVDPTTLTLISATSP